VKRIVLLVALLPLLASAQVRKCQDAAGNVSYRDVCPTAARETTISARPNSLDTSAMRADAQRLQDQQQLQNLMSNPPPQCRFKAFKYADAKGQALRQDATAECVQNILAAQRGEPPTLMAYQLWKDHYSQKSSERQALSNQISAAENARAVARSNENAVSDLGRRLENKTYTCTPNRLNPDFTCK
jgi:hypothetical protein